MSKIAAKNWTKGHARKTLASINDELTVVLKGGDPKEAIKNIKKHLKTLDQLVKPPVSEIREKPTKSNLPAPIRKRVETAIKRNRELMDLLRQLKID